MERFTQDQSWNFPEDAKFRDNGKPLTENQLVGTLNQQDAELTRLRAELAEARRHAKVLMEKYTYYPGQPGRNPHWSEMEQAITYAKGIS